MCLLTSNSLQKYNWETLICCQQAGECTGQNCQVVFYVKSNQKLYRAPERFCSSSWSREGILTKLRAWLTFVLLGFFPSADSRVSCET